MGDIMLNGNLKLALQKNGRLTEKSLNLLKSCDIDIEEYSSRLIVTARNYDLDILLLRDDDIPEYVMDGVADIGIVGEDVLYEKKANVDVVRKLGYGKCRLSLAIPENQTLEDLSGLNGKRIATSFPNILKSFLTQNNINATVVEISGSVEIAPSLGVADYICDLVSTGNTLKFNKLKKSFDIFSSQAVLIANKNIENDHDKKSQLDNLLVRIDSALTARKSKYLMMNAPKNALEKIEKIIPSLKSPTILPLAEPDMVAVHAVIPTNKFWEIYKDLKEAGASGILLLPIDNMIV
ncbi:ATP phosphoribosyltransferase [Melioribacter sp. Ez-97]|uniref:ATP phosphoribosyltransferase n=1 Tax=Melioribacter sp. Ez-97 TaxID=3423434 RepID=UPI003ED9D800